MKRICIFHFAPLELFPPVMNMLSFLGSNLPNGCFITVYSTYAGKEVKLYETNNERIEIKRFGKFGTHLSFIARLKLYLNFNIRSLLNAYTLQPKTLLYYETSSAFPPFLLKKLYHSIRLFIHYHEYMTADEYDNIKFLQSLHRLEKKIYHKATWISHTNEERLQLFKSDIQIGNNDILHTMPNFPSRKWAKVEVSNKMISLPVKIVYVGAIGFEALYIKEFARWVEAQKGKVVWDVYSQQDNTELKKFLISINSRFINVHPFISYHELPLVLSRYDVGVILYKGATANFIHNAPNKLFEYLACGLDVWFPQELKGAYRYIRTNACPKVISICLSNASALDTEQLINRQGLPFAPTDFYCEDQYEQLGNALLK